MREKLLNIQKNNLSSNRPLVCIIGTLRCLDVTALNLADCLIKPLNADLMICVSKISEKDEKVAQYFPNCRLVKVDIYDDSRDGYETLLDQYTEKYGFENRWRDLLQIKGNWLGGLENRSGSGMHLNYNYWKLLEQIQSMRSEGLIYDRYIITRSDYLWLLQHPPLQKLNPKKVWIPLGEDYYGYNDRHAVCSNDNIEKYLSLFYYMLNLKCLEYLRDNQLPINHETQLKKHLDYHSVSVGRFKNIAYLTSSKNTLSNWSKSQTIQIENCDYTYKYENELRSALRNSHEFTAHQNWNRIVIKNPWLWKLSKRIKSFTS
jgi:hypothetical protein